jgi:hypothetical protein
LQRQHDQRKIAFRADRTQAHQSHFFKITIGLTTEPSNRENPTHSSNLEWIHQPSSVPSDINISYLSIQQNLTKIPKLDLSSAGLQ